MKTPLISILLLLVLTLISFSDQEIFAANPYDASKVSHREVAYDSEWGQRYYSDVKQVFDKRCVVCHGCYDAPCQLKLSSTAGIDRGANKVRVYNGARLLQAKYVSPFADAFSTKEWRERDFYPVLNEGSDRDNANTEGSLIYKFLELKNKHPMPNQAFLPKEITLELNRKQQCPTIYQFTEFSKKFSLWGMPYGLPAISDDEQNTIFSWLKAGSPIPSEKPLSSKQQKQVDKWEAYLNNNSLKAQLVSRYIYEHLYLFHLYFVDNDALKYFQIVRSHTDTGEPIALIDTVRPYDDPGVEQFYYRLKPVNATLVSKTHMPYELSDARMQRWNQLFFDNNYKVSEVVPYDVDVASNPFVAFEQIPAISRYQFMLDDAEMIIMAFMKGPVCRGQIALDVIRDRFWVFFVNPNKPMSEDNSKFLASNSDNLQLPAKSGNPVFTAIPNWKNYAELQKTYLKNKFKYVEEISDQGEKLNLNLIWDGEGINPNAALTVFRHTDSASVVKGLVGEKPTTAWLIDYTVLERIHYLLVAGYNVFGNVGHQLLTRLYMDFLRMESEINFIQLLPVNVREKVWDEWYTDADHNTRDYYTAVSDIFIHDTNIHYKTDHPQSELLDLMSQLMSGIKDQGYDINESNTSDKYLHEMNILSAMPNAAIQHLPDVTFLSIEDTKGNLNSFTLLRNKAHTNVASLFNEKSSLLPDKDTLTIVNGFLGAYPNAFWHVSDQRLNELVNDANRINSVHDYAKFMTNYGVRRTAADFWQHSDKLHANFNKIAPIDYSLFDYNRLENR